MKINKFIGDKAFYSRLFAVMIPILVQTLITNFVNLLDNIMVGQVGTEQMSGVAIVNQLFFVYNLCIFAGVAGAGIMTAQYFGKGDIKGVADTFRAKFIISLVSCTLFMLAFHFADRTLISLFIHEGGESFDMASTLGFGRAYLSVMLFQMLPFAFEQVYVGTLRETNLARVPMLAGIAAVFVNLILNYILIFGKLGFRPMGVVGAAIATVIARYVECAIIVVWTHLHSEEAPFIVGVYRTLRVPSALAKQIFVLGIPLLINELLWAGGMTTLNQCYSMRGLEVVSAVSISSTVSNLFFCAFISMGNSIAILVGQVLGSGDLERAVDEDRKLIAFSVCLCACVGVVMFLLAPVFPQIYNTTDGVKALAVKLLKIGGLLLPLNGFTNACYFTLRSGGKTIITFLFDSVYLWVLCIPLAFVLSRFTALPIIPMYIVVQAMELVKCTLGFILVKNRTWVRDLVNT